MTKRRSWICLPNRPEEARDAGAAGPPIGQRFLFVEPSAQGSSAL
jgi:hypothetical protein